MGGTLGNVTSQTKGESLLTSLLADLCVKQADTIAFAWIFAILKALSCTGWRDSALMAAAPLAVELAADMASTSLTKVARNEALT